MSTRWNLEEATERIRHAGFDPSEWPDALSFLAETIGSTGAVVFGTDSHVAHAPSSVGLHQTMDEYSRDGWYERDRRREGVGVMLSNGVMTDQDMSYLSLRSDFYRDFLTRHKCEWFSGIGFKTGEDLWCLAMQRSAASGPFQADEVERLKALWRPLADAATLTRVIGDRHKQATVDALELVEHAAIICDHKGDVVASNETAEKLLARAYDPKLKNLKFVHKKSAQLYFDLLATALKSAITASATALSADLVDNFGRILTVRAVSLSTKDAFVFHEARILLLFKLRNDDLKFRATKYGLTAAERAVAEALCQGRSVAHIAQIRQVKEESIRTQLKSIFSKTNVHSQGQLVAMLIHGRELTEKD